VHENGAPRAERGPFGPMTRPAFRGFLGVRNMSGWRRATSLEAAPARFNAQIATTDAYVVSRRERKKVEMLFAHLKRILKLDGLSLRGPCGARDEFLLAATAQNLRKLAKLIRRRRQPPPKALWALCPPTSAASTALFNEIRDEETLHAAWNRTSQLAVSRSPWRRPCPELRSRTGPPRQRSTGPHGREAAETALSR
jgi:hypothetical protein